MANLFNSIQVKPNKSNSFDLSHDVKMTLNMGELVPTFVMDCVPGDKVFLNSESMLRFAPMLAPVMHKIDVYQHFFFVPNRIIWSGWEDFITGKTTVAAPYLVSAGGWGKGTLADYLGLPLQVGTATEAINALPFAAYQKIYNEYYRDQNLITEVTEADLIDGDNTANIGELNQVRLRAWKHDYFTACLPFAQKGDSVDIPLGDVVLENRLDAVPKWNDVQGAWSAGAHTIMGDDGGGVDGVLDKRVTPNSDNRSIAYDPDGTLQVEPTSINSLRRAFRLQEYFERLARGGQRYIEVIKAFFNVNSSDKRLQRPEYLGGNVQAVVISEVLQTTQKQQEADPPMGNMGGHAISVGSGEGFSYFCEEYGYIIGICSIQPKAAYMQGIPRHFSKLDKLDYYWPPFANIGEQEVLGKEIYYDNNATNNNSVFGYIPRYAEYKYMSSRVAGDFRDNLAYWHLANDYASRPLLNQSFIECNPSQRIFAVEDPTEHKVYAHVFNKCIANRQMPVFGTPQF